MLTIIDRRTGQQYDIPVTEGTIKATDLRKIKSAPDDFGMMSFDPGLTNTAACHSGITFIDGDKGILEYRGYPIDQLAENMDFLDVAYLLQKGELPTPEESASWKAGILQEMKVPLTIQSIIAAFPQNSYSMSVLMTGVAALGAIYPDARSFNTPELRAMHVRRLVAKIPVIAAYALRRNRGQAFVEADPSLSFAGNMLRMFFAQEGETYTVHPKLEHALDVLLTLHADHEQNCSTSTVRSVASSGSDPYASFTGGVAALSGPLHGGANEAVLKMLRQIGTRDKIPSFLAQVETGEAKLMGFGHRVYKTYDPRAKIIKKMAEDVFSVTGTNPLLDVAVELERIALSDEYFIKRKLYPNVDFYSGLIYEAIGLPVDMFPVMFAIGRAPGWGAHWMETEIDPELKISRPLQIFTGPARRSYPGME